MSGGSADPGRPRPADDPVVRPPPGRLRLLAALDRLPTYAAVLVSAPAGYGKTSLARAWVDAGGTAVAWVTVGPHHAAPLAFWSGLVRALRDVHPPAWSTASEPALATTGDLDALVEVLHEVVAHAGRTVVVIDGIHWLGPRVRQRLALLLERLPPSMRMVLVSRSKAGPALARPGASGLLVEVGVADLRLDEDEARQVVLERVSEPVDPTVVDEVVRRAEGWPMGLLLSADGVRDGQLPSRDPVAAGYFANEVLADAPPDLAEFLVEVSVLDELTAARCDAVRERTDSRRYLAAADTAMLLVERLDADREALRLHPMFRAALLDVLEAGAPGRALELHRRAARHLSDAGEHRAAIEHVVAGGDPDLALEVLAAAAPELADRGLHDLLRQATAAIPAVVIAADPRRAIQFAWTLGHAGRVALCGEWVERALPAVPPDDHQALAVLSAIRSGCAGARGDIAGLEQFQAEADRQVALGAVPDEEVFHRKWTYDARAFLAVGRSEEAAEIIERGMSQVVTGTAVPAFDRLGLLARLAHHRGQLQLADEHARHAITTWEAEPPPDTPLTLVDALWVRMSVHLERFEDDEAAHALELAERGVSGFDPTFIPGVVTACARGRLLRTTGQPGAARAHLAEVRNGWAEFPGPSPAAGLASLVAIEELHAALAEGDLDGAQLALSRVAERPDREILDIQLGVATGDPDAALRLRRWTPRSVREVVTHELLLARTTADETEARQHVERALSVGVPEGFLRTFVVNREIVGHLREIFRRATSPFVVPLLAHLARGGDDLVEPLTPRELDVLRLLPSHLTTPGIAEQLGISHNTAKSHVKAIYRKLGVEGRDAAVEHAIGLGLVAPDSDR